MRVFITGGTGFIGSHIVKKLSARGDQVTILSRNPSAFPFLKDLSGVSFIEGTHADESPLKASLPGHDACIHNALIWGDEPSELELKDTQASINLFLAAAETGVEQLIYTSSTAVHRPFQAQMDEQTRITTADLYGATKACSEIFLSAISHQTPIRGTIVRPGPVVGAPAFPNGPHKSDRRFTEFIAQARQNLPIQIGAGDARQFTPVEGLADLYLAILDSRDGHVPPKLSAEIYLAVSPHATSWRSIAERIIDLTASKSVIVEEPSNASASYFSPSKIQQEFELRLHSSQAIEDHIAKLLDS